LAISEGETCCDARERGLKAVNRHVLAFMTAFAFISRMSLAQSVEKEPAAVIELGAAADRSLTEARSNFGPTAAVEVTPIENWLELEAGVTPLFRQHSTEWTIDLLFKKPWTLSDKKEFMLGIGPEWIHTNAFGVKTNSVGLEVAPDLMFWSSRKHRFGWYLERVTNTSSGRGLSIRWA
jgi:hypothetical protein